MTASEPVTMDVLVNGLKFETANEGEIWSVRKNGVDYELAYEEESMNVVLLSSDGLTITFGDNVSRGPEFTGFTFNA